ncbi:glycosyl hydrolase family 30 TIM-barrel domain-containing protein [Phthorimaea operculella]|nr:glycosyl hydrolase family 30 TIM-barrel domain-containing protein [Phthorimaea operculella]
MRAYVVFLSVISVIGAHKIADKPCAAKLYPGESVVCVCNATYCDDITRETPKSGEFVTYTSTGSGLRLQKAFGKLKKYSKMMSAKFNKTLVLHPSVKYQKIEGFGGAVTDSAGINWKSLSEGVQQKLIDSYYGPKGIGYTMARVPIGGTDFSTHFYTYNDLPVNDTKLSNFSLAHEDYHYKIPMIKKIQTASKLPVKILAAIWTSPSWMKRKTPYNACGHLKEEFYQSYADYIVKFIQQYTKLGIPIWAVKWIVNNFGPAIRNNTNTLILTGEDQRFTIPLWEYSVVKLNPEVLKYMDGIAVHSYADPVTPASLLHDAAKSFPGRFLIYTEFCEGSFPWEDKNVVPGSWTRGESYLNNIITNINSNVVGWIDWNLCLNPKGGPTWTGNNVDSPIHVFAEDNRFEKQPMFYAMAHVAKFVGRGSYRIKVHEEKVDKKVDVEQFAVVTPNDTVVVVLANNGNSSASVGIKLGDDLVDLSLLPRSFTTVELPNNLDENCKLQTMVVKVPGSPIDVDYDADSATVTYNPC